jgi:hypothetical protein
MRIAVVLLAAAAVGPIFVCAAPPAGYAPIATKPCTNDAPQNIMATLPRMNSRGQPISADLGTYGLVNCSSSSGFGCALGVSTSNLPAALLNPDADSVFNYVWGIVLYGALALAMCLASIAFSVLFCVGRYCCCCCNRTNCCCIGLQCGGHEPTPRMCACGAIATESEAQETSPRSPGGAGVAVPGGILIGPGIRRASGGAEGGKVVKHAYPVAETVLVWLLLLVFVAFIIAMIGVGAAQGFLAIPTAAKEVAPTLTTAFMPTVNNVVTRVGALAVALGSQVLGPQLLEFNRTLQTGLDLNNVDSQLGCVVGVIDGLPDIGAVTTFANQMNVSLTAMKGGVNGLIGEVNSVIAGRNNLSTAVNNLNGVVVGLGNSLNSVAGALTGVNSSLTPLSTVQFQLVNVSIPSLRSDLSLLQANVGLPNSTLLTSTSGPANVADVSGTGTLNRLVQGTMAGNANEIGVLGGKLLSINNTVGGVLGPVNFSRTADTLLTINALATTTRTVHIPALAAAMASAEAAVASLPRASSVSPFVNSIDATARSITFAGIIAQISNMQTILNGLPNITSLITLIDSVRLASNLIPCAQSLVGEMRRVNTTLIRIPPSLGDALRILDDANATVAQAMSQIDGIKGTLNSAKAQIDAVNVTSYLIDARSAWATVNSSLASFNMSDVNARVAQLDVSIPVNFTQLRGTLSSFNTTLGSFTLNTSMATTLRTFESDKGAFLTNISTVLSDVQLLARGYCSNAPATSCTANVDCGGVNTCNGIATYRCRANPATACTQDSGCPVNDRCLADIGRAVGLKAGLDVMGASAPDVSGSLSTLTTITGSASSLDTASMRASIATANASIAAVSTASIQAQLVSVNSSLGALNTANIQSTLTTVQSAVLAVDFAQFTPQLNTLNSTVGNIRNNARTMVNNARGVVQALVRLLNVDLRDYTGRLSAGSLNNALATQGMGGIVNVMTGIGSDVLDNLRGNLSAFFSLPTTNLRTLVNADRVSELTGTGTTYANRRGAGFIAFAASAANIGNPLPIGAAGAATVFENSAGARYADGKICVTDDCIAATVTDYMARTVGSISSGAVPLSITPLAIMNLVWLLPAVVVLFGLCSLVSRWVCKRPEWQKCPLGCMTGCIMFQLPMCFALAALLFPMSMFISDFCTGSRNVAYAAAITAAPGACSAISGTPVAGTSGADFACSLSSGVNLPSGARVGLSAQVTLPAYIKALLGDGQCPATDPWAPVVNDAMRTLRPLLYGEARYFIGPTSTVLPADLAIQPLLANTIYNATNVTSNVLVDWTSDFIGSVASCPALNNMFLQTLGVTCCTLYRPFYWIASVFYLIGWAYCCCGLPAGLLGRKRLPTAVWGTLGDKTVSAEPTTAAGRFRASNAGMPSPGVYGGPAAAVVSRKRELPEDVVSRMSPLQHADANGGGGGGDGNPTPSAPPATVNVNRGGAAAGAPVLDGGVDEGVFGGKVNVTAFPPARISNAGAPAATPGIAYPPMMGMNAHGAPYHHLPPPGYGAVPGGAAFPGHGYNPSAFPVPGAPVFPGPGGRASVEMTPMRPGSGMGMAGGGVPNPVASPMSATGSGATQTATFT